MQNKLLPRTAWEVTITHPLLISSQLRRLGSYTSMERELPIVKLERPPIMYNLLFNPKAKHPDLGLRRFSISVHLLCWGSYASTLDKLLQPEPNPPATYIMPLTSAQAKSRRAKFNLESAPHLCSVSRMS
jgi:hypothetical protein